MSQKKKIKTILSSLSGLGLMFWMEFEKNSLCPHQGRKRINAFIHLLKCIYPNT